MDKTFFIFCVILLQLCQKEYAVSALRQFVTLNSAIVKSNESATVDTTIAAAATTTTTTTAPTTTTTTTTAEPTTITTTTPAPPLKCSLGWELYQKSCFFIQRSPSSWSGAVSACNTVNSNLASITNPGELAFVTAVASEFRAPSMWIGLSYVNDKFQWVDGSEINVVHWSPYLPPHEEWKNKSCAAIKSDLSEDPGYWMLSECDKDRILMCKSRAFVDVSKNPTPLPGCSEGMAHWRGTCYWFLDTPMHALNATLECQHQEGFLINMIDMPELYFVKSLLYDKDEDEYWTGLNQLRTTGIFQWSHGEALRLNFRQLGLREFSTNPVGSSGRCTVIQMKNGAHKMSVVDCFERKKALCKKIVNSSAVVPWGTTEKPAFQCEYSGWTYLENSKKCVKLFRSELRWKEAEQYCLTLKGHLLSSKIYRDNSYIIKTFLPGPIWGGLHYDNKHSLQNVTVKWTDGTDIISSDTWSLVEANLTLTLTASCSIIESQSGRITFKSCFEKRKFVCVNEKMSDEVKEHVTPGRIPLAKCSNQGHGWYFDNGYCYALASSIALQRKLSFKRASKECRSIGAELVSFHHFDEITTVLEVISLSSSSSVASIWMGLKSSNFGEPYKWSDGTPVNLLHWQEHEASQINAEVCAYMLLPTGEWSRGSCHYRKEYVCKKPYLSTNTQSMTTPKPQGYCEPSWYRYGSKCYKFFSSKLSWTNAKSSCLEKKSDLVSIHSQDQQETMALISDEGSRYWIGMNDRETEGVYKWSDGSKIDYVNWATDEPNDFLNRVTEDCIEVLSERAQSHWNDIICSYQRSYICQKDIISGEGITDEPEYMRRCYRSNEPGYSYKNSCYTFMNNYQNLTWYNAEEICNKYQSHLVSMRTVGEIIEMKRQVFPKNFQGYIWIGLNDVVDSKPWLWSDGWNVNFTNWARQEPKISKELESRCAVMDSSGNWYSKVCDELHRFVCRYNSVDVPPTRPSVVEAECPKPKRGSHKWLNFGGEHCYKVFNGRFKWIDGETKCKEEGGHLATFHSIHDINVMSILFPSMTRSFWIGLFRNVADEFRWVDGTPVNFLNFKNDTILSHERSCIIMDKDSLKWDVKLCRLYYNIICSINKNSSSLESSLSGTEKSYKAEKKVADGAHDVTKSGLIAGITILAIVLVVAAVIGLFFAKRKQLYSNVGIKFARQTSDSEALSFAGE